MSTKIYYAMRFPQDRLNDFLDWSRTEVLKVVKERLETLMADVSPEDLDECPERFRGEGRLIWERFKRMRNVMAICRDAANTSQRDPLFDIECGFHIWLHEGRFYAIPFAEPWIKEVLDADRPDWAEEYHYQNQTDKPDEVSEADWAERAAIWEEVCLKHFNTRRMFFEIVNCRTESASLDLERELAAQALWDFDDNRKGLRL